MVRVGDRLLINPRHVAFVERDQHGNVAVHMGLPQVERVPRGTLTERRAHAPDVVESHPVLTFSGAEAAAVWGALISAGMDGD